MVSVIKLNSDVSEALCVCVFLCVHVCMNVTDLRPHFFLCINEVPVDLKLKIEFFLGVTPC